MSFSPSLIVSAALAGVLLAHGCATVSSSRMVPETVTAVDARGGTVKIDAEGSGRQAFIGRPLVKTEALQSAVRETVLSSGLFGEVIDVGDADQILAVTVDRIDEPEIGLDMTCEVALRWRLMSGDRSRTIWEEVITTKETITSYEEVDSSKRGQMAIETALRANMMRGVVRLSNAG